MLTKKVLIISLIIVLVISLIPFAYYIFTFGSLTLSTQKDEWGQFGDFIGGALNPFLSFANILILGYLTYEISRIDLNAQERSLQIQKKLVLSQLRHDAFQDYVRVIDGALQNYDDAGQALGKSVGQKSNVVAEKLGTLNVNFSHLFPILKTDKIFNDVIGTLHEISSLNSEFLRNQNNETAIKFGLSIEKLRREKEIIKEKLQNFMMKELGR